MRAHLLSLLAILLLSGCASTQTTQPQQASITQSDLPDTEVDRFQVNGYEVVAYFTDPLPTVVRGTPGFASMPPREQAGKLVDHLRTNDLYRFEVLDAQGERVGEFGLQGRPEAQDTPALYQRVEYRRSESGVEGLDPEPSGIRGYLFEHMEPFQTEEGGRVVGNAVPFFEGIIMRVIPYEEVKSDMMARIESVTG